MTHIEKIFESTRIVVAKAALRRGSDEWTAPPLGNFGSINFELCLVVPYTDYV